MTTLEKQFPMALIRWDLSGESDEYTSYLALHRMHEGEYEPYEYSLMGDLRPLFGVGDGFEPNEDGLFGNYIPQAKIAEELERCDPITARAVKLESEGGTFFAYSERMLPLCDLVAFIKKFSHPGYDPC